FILSSLVYSSPSSPSPFPYTTLFRSVWLSLGELLPAQTARQASANLPPLPEVETARFLPAIRNQVRAAELSARAHPTDAERVGRSEEHTSELQSRVDLVCRLLLEKQK